MRRCEHRWKGCEGRDDGRAGVVDERPIDDETRTSRRDVPENFHGTPASSSLISTSGILSGYFAEEAGKRKKDATRCPVSLTSPHGNEIKSNEYNYP
ncbi:hypothetical protein K0M31_018580, partial [Melipona bicolor]